MKFNAINYFGAAIVILMLIPNAVYALRYHNIYNKCRSVLLIAVEQIGRYACIALMFFPLGVGKFGFDSNALFILYAVGNALLLAAYQIVFIFYGKRPSAKKAIVLAVLPTLIFLLCGLTLGHWLLAAAAVLFGAGHISMMYINNTETEADKMSFYKDDGIPAYSNDKSPEQFADGSGLADDMLSDLSEESTMLLYRNTDRVEFLSYCKELKKRGFECTFENENESGIFREFKTEKLIYYVYFTCCDSCVRLIKDRASSCSVNEFSDAVGDEKYSDTCLMQYGLRYGHMIKGKSADCGMNYVIRLRDGRFIVIDGGESEQSTDEAVNDFAEILRELAGDNKITIALWFCTHAHNDHIDFFMKYLRLFRDDIKLERTMFNFPSAQYIPLMPSTSMMRERLKAYYRDAEFLKPHTGEKISIGGCDIEIMLTHEDMLPMNEEKPYFGMNETSTVAKFSFEGDSMLILADIPEQNGKVLTARYNEKSLSCTFIQAAHHLINRVEEVYAKAKAEYVLIPRWNKTLSGENYDIICKYYNKNNFVVAGASTAAFFISDGVITYRSYYSTAGDEYDNSSI